MSKLSKDVKKELSSLTVSFFPSTPEVLLSLSFTSYLLYILSSIYVFRVTNLIIFSRMPFKASFLSKVIDSQVSQSASTRRVENY